MARVFFRYLTDKSKRPKINEILEKEEGIAMASEVLITISKDEIEQARRESELKFELDMQSKRVTAMREGLQKGMKKGIREGKRKGIREGRREGLREGRQEIIELLKSGKSIEEIINQYDGLEETIED